MNPAIVDIKALVTNIVSAVGKDNVASEMEEMYDWVNVDRNDIPGFVANFFENEIDDDEFDATLEMVYAEFYSIAHEFDYTITMFD